MKKKILCLLVIFPSIVFTSILINGAFAAEAVNGHYNYIRAYDSYGNWYLESKSGRIRGNVDSIEELDQETLTICRNSVNYRGEFGENGIMESGWAIQHINCKGYDSRKTCNYIIVHETDSRYNGVSEWVLWENLGTWEYSTYTISGQGNLLKKKN